jgi:FkbM family methyltransferase
MLGGRSPRLIAESIFEPRQYRALVRMPGVYPAFPEVARRYFVGGGRYPYTCRVRTPTGTVAVAAYSHHDIFTVHEMFAREDYRAGPDVRVIVDIGSNVGISGLYFLSRNSTSRCYLHEPVPRNVERLRANLAGLEPRYELDEVAVAAQGGVVDFMVEPTGRYGGIGLPGAEQIRVRCRPVGEVLGNVLDREGVIDVLKIDTEGAELETLLAIPVDQLARIRTIYYETKTPVNPDPDGFEMHFACQTCALVSRRPALPRTSVGSRRRR